MNAEAGGIGGLKAASAELLCDYGHEGDPIWMHPCMGDPMGSGPSRIGSRNVGFSARNVGLEPEMGVRCCKGLA